MQASGISGVSSVSVLDLCQARDEAGSPGQRLIDPVITCTKYEVLLVKYEAILADGLRSCRPTTRFALEPVEVF